MDQVFVQIRFSTATPYGDYQDALYYSMTEYNAMSQAQIDTAKETRVNNFISLIEDQIGE